MPKSKRAPALFELISKPQAAEGLRLRTPQPAPGSLIEQPPLAPPPSGTPSSPPAGSEVPLQGTDPPVAAVPTPVLLETPPAPLTKGGSDGSGGGGEPWWRIAGGRIRLSLSQRGATIALSAAGLLLIVVHYLGYSLGEKRGKAAALADRPAATAGVKEIEEARRGPVTRRLFEGVGEDPTATVTAVEPVAKVAAPVAVPQPAQYEPSRAAWVQGHTYIVVQDFRKDTREDAEMAQEYLAQNGVPSVILDRQGNYPHRLITAQGFDRDDAAQKKLAEDYQDRVRRLGQAYLQAGGRYDFKTAYFIKLTGDTW